MALECSLKDSPCFTEWIDVCFKRIREFVSSLLWNHFIGMRAVTLAVTKAHKTADSKIDAKACLLKHMVTKQSLLL